MNLTHHTVAACLIGAASLAAAPAASADDAPATQAFTLRMDGHSDDAVALLERAVADDDQNAASWFELARTEMYHMRLDDAAAALDHAIALDPDNARYHFLAGLNAGYNAVLKAKSPKTRDLVEPQMGKSLASFKRAVELDPDDHATRIQLINMLLQAPPKQGGCRNDAKKHVEFLEAADPVYGVEARCMLLGNDKKKQLELWTAVAVAHPTRAEAHTGLARAYVELGDLDRASDQIDEAIRLDIDQAPLLLAFCREHAAAKDFQSAREAADQYLATNPPAPLRAFGTFYLAVLQKQQGNMEQAEVLLAEANAIDPRVWTTYMEPPAALFDAP